MTKQLKSIGYKVAAATAMTLSYASVARGVECDPTGGSSTIAAGAQCAAPNGAADNLFVTNGIFQQISNTLIFLVGAIAVIMLIIGGLRYVTSNGEAASIKGAKDTITYAIIGIIVAILSFALVSFVIGRFSTVPA